eukprot:jgi/Chlat1/7588/Chrsp63S07072
MDQAQSEVQDQVQDLDHALVLRLAFMYYNPIALCILFVWLWGLNLWVWERNHVNYERVLDLPDSGSHLQVKDTFRFAAILSLLLLASLGAFLHAITAQSWHLASLHPALLYALLPVLMLAPVPYLYPRSRAMFTRCLQRMLMPIMQPVLFVDLFVADVFTSMAKVLSDVERVLCRLTSGPILSVLGDANDVCGSHSAAIPALLALPYLIRLLQCLRSHRDTGEKGHLLNALKYFTAFPVIFLSFSKYYVPLPHWVAFYKPAWLLASVVNSCYSFYWDVARDWDLTLFSANNGCLSGVPVRHPGLRSTLFFPWPWVYYWAIFSDALLRATWTYKLSAHLRHNEYTVTLISLCEILRRWQWMFFRVETEWRRICLKQGTLPDAPDGTTVPLIIAAPKPVSNGWSDYRSD